MKTKERHIGGIILAAILLPFMLLCGCGGSGEAPPEDKAPAPEVPAFDREQFDYSEQAQEYLEYIGTNLTDRNYGTKQHNDARDWIAAELLRTGYPEEAVTIQKFDGADSGNIILKVPGAYPDDGRFVVVGAHYDGDGVGDNGSGVALLLATAAGLRQYALPMTTWYVFFDQEELGAYGSKAFVDGLSQDELQNLQYMVNIDAVAFGDYCNIYGGAQDRETKEVSETELYEYVCRLAEDMGFNVYGTADLDGYFAEHGEGPAPDPRGVFTNPWTLENPAPSYPPVDERCAYSPTTIPASDHLYFMSAGIPYVYFEATNWYVADPDKPEISYIAYSDVGDLSLGINGCIMNTEFDNLEYLNEHFPGRSLEHFRLYSPILSRLLLEPFTE